MREAGLEVVRGNQSYLQPLHQIRLTLSPGHGYRPKSLLRDQTMFPTRRRVVWANRIEGGRLTYLSHRLEQGTGDGLFVGQCYLCDE